MANLGLLISVDELDANSDILSFDCRAHLTDRTFGINQFKDAHIPNAQYADLETHLSSSAGKGGRHPLPNRDDLVQQLHTWGINNDSILVSYDQNNGAFAARFWWLLRWLGHDQVYVLNGGLDAWQNAGKRSSSIETKREQGSFRANTSLTKVCDVAEIQKGELQLLDARDPERFYGRTEPIDAVAGHIPGAVCSPFTDNMSQGHFKSPQQLTEKFSPVSYNATVACYCGSGVTATHNILAMLLAGYDEPALYPGSWSGWITDPARPIATDE